MSRVRTLIGPRLSFFLRLECQGGRVAFRSISDIASSFGLGECITSQSSDFSSTYSILDSQTIPTSFLIFLVIPLLDIPIVILTTSHPIRIVP